MKYVHMSKKRICVTGMEAWTKRESVDEENKSVECEACRGGGGRQGEVRH